MKLKDTDQRILFELMKNSKVSDRQLAKKIGVSQPTVTRRRARLEREVIDGYTTIPKWKKLGYEILAVTLVKSPLRLGSTGEGRNAFEKSMKWLEKQPNVIFGAGCRGMGMTGVMFSLHRSYADLDEFLTAHREQLGPILEDVQSIVVNLAGKAVYRPLNLKYLAEVSELKST
ncbi:MAG: Lrp/AsnC family transcriptional regulator [Candidatus Bathyarchaeota archaeon]|nr:MAG: Lrp/AsnC family transcriptional regulator [Candidatus Bathyarchaeota archaeon]